MRTFDYRHLPKGLFDGKVGDANVRLYEDKGKLELMKTVHREELEALRRQAHFDNVDASTRIDGFYVDTPRIRALLNGAEPSDEMEAQIVGYSKALSLVEGGTLNLSTASIVALYETLFAHRDLGRKSRYRKKDFIYVQVDGHPQAMPVSPVNAFETPLVLGGACDSLADAFNAETCSPLILNAVFTVDLLCIRPFDEGNGRISRLFAGLLLEKAGFDIARYVSIDRIIEDKAMDYYDALNGCVEKWDRGLNDYTPYALYWLNIVHAAYEKAFDLVEAKSRMPEGKSERVCAFVREAAAPVTKRDIRAAIPDVSEATVEAALGKMVKDGVVEKLGAGRSTSYRWKER